MKKPAYPTAFIIIILAFCIFTYITINIVIQTGHAWNIDFSKASEYGNLLGGIFAFLSAWLLYKPSPFKANHKLKQKENKLGQHLNLATSNYSKSIATT